jgi:hypothetical protein
MFGKLSPKRAVVPAICSERGARPADRFVDEVERHGLRLTEPVDVARGAHGTMDGRAVTLGELEPDPQRSSTSRMSEKMIAASTPSCSTAITVTSAAASGVLQSSRKPSRSRMARYSG